MKNSARGEGSGSSVLGMGLIEWILKFILFRTRRWYSIIRREMFALNASLKSVPTDFQASWQAEKLFHVRYPDDNKPANFSLRRVSYSTSRRFGTRNIVSVIIEHGGRVDGRDKARMKFLLELVDSFRFYPPTDNVPPFIFDNNNFLAARDSIEFLKTSVSFPLHALLVSVIGQIRR